MSLSRFFCTLGVIFIFNAAAEASANVTGPPKSSFVNASLPMDAALAGAPVNGTNMTTEGPITKQVTESPGGSLTTARPRATPGVSTPKPATRPSAIPTTTMKQIPATPEPVVTNDFIGIIVMIVILVVAVGLALACCIAKNRGRRYSVNVATSLGEADVPLHSVDPEPLHEVVTLNGLSTFPGSGQRDSPEPVQEVQRAEAGKSADDPESAAPSAETSEDKPTQEAAEPSPAAPVEPETEEKTQVPDKTPDESVDEAKATEETPLDSAE